MKKRIGLTAFFCALIAGVIGIIFNALLEGECPFLVGFALGIDISACYYLTTAIMLLPTEDKRGKIVQRLFNFFITNVGIGGMFCLITSSAKQEPLWWMILVCFIMPVIVILKANWDAKRNQS